MADPLRIAILGVTGRMGKALLAAAAESAEVRVMGGTASTSSQWLGHELRALGANSEARVSARVEDALQGAQVAIDFTLPDATAKNLAACVANRCALVIGTTGH